MRAKSQSLVEMRRQSFSKTKKSDDNASLSKTYLLGAIDEALYRQMSALQAFDRQNQNQNVKEDSRVEQFV